MSWIKMRDSLDLDPDVIGIAGELGMDELSVIGRLWKLWTWADQHSMTGNAMRVTEALLDRITGCNGFATAMRNVGWLEGQDYALNFPNFDRHNGQTAKTRALMNRRVSRYRYAKSVTESLQKRDNTVTESLHERVPDKIREEVCNAVSVTETEKGADPPKGDFVQHAEAKLDLTSIADPRFGEKITTWGMKPQYDYWLNEALPIPRPQWEAFLWLYRLSDDDEIFTNRRHPAWTQRKDSFSSLLRDLKGACQRAFQVQKRMAESLGDIDAIPE